MNALEQKIDQTLELAFLNLRHVKPHCLKNRYQAYAVLQFAESILPDLKKAGAVSGGYELPSSECIGCLQEYFHKGACPSRRCRSFADKDRMRPVREWNSCPILHRWVSLRMPAPISGCSGQMKSTSRIVRHDNDKS